MCEKCVNINFLKQLWKKNCFPPTALKEVTYKVFLFDETLKGSKSLNSILFDELIMLIIIHEGKS
jgi:hypothetical protein